MSCYFQIKASLTSENSLGYQSDRRTRQNDSRSGWSRKGNYHFRQMKHQLDATLCRFYFCRVTLHVSGASAHHQEYLKLVQRPLVHVLSLQVSHHISLLGPELNVCREGIAAEIKPA